LTNTLGGVGHTIQTSRGHTNGAHSYTNTVYAPCACSPLAKIQQVSQPYASGSSPSAWTVYTYDGLERTVKTVQPDGVSAITYAYSGNQTTVTDPAGNWKQFTKDVLGNLTTVVEPDPANQPGGTLTTTYTYDWMNHVSGVSVTRGSTTQTRTFVYNDTGTLASATNPENGTVNYTYNSLNLLTTKIDAKGQETDYTYDGVNRLILRKQYPYGKSSYTAGCSYVAYAYDGTLPVGSTFTSQYNKGRLTTVDYNTIYYYYGSGGACSPSNTSSYYLGLGYVETYSYHPAGGVIDKELQVNPLISGTNYPIGTPATLDVYYTFNQAGQIATIAYPTTGSQYNQTTNTYTPNTFTYAYDTMGRPNSLKVDSTFANPYSPTGYNWVQNVTYDYAGRRSSLQYWDGAWDGQYMAESKTWNGSGQLASISFSSYALSGGMQYSYSATQNNGQITQAVDTISGEAISYQYDLLKRLVSASATPTSGSTSAAWTETFQYDGFGNLTAKALNGTSTPIPVNAATNQLANAYYDANGNMTSGAGASFTYDASNRIVSETAVSGGNYGNEYAPDNKRIHQTPSSGTDEWIFYGANGQKLGVYSIEQWYDNNGNAHSLFYPLRTSVWFGGKMIYENGLVYLDRLGTNHAQSAQFLPYGDEITSTSNDRTKFATYTRDSYTGLDYADQRFYASTYGNYTTPDPSMDNVDYRNPISWNAYSYTMGDPINANDPSGMAVGDPVTVPPVTLGTPDCGTNFIDYGLQEGLNPTQLFNSSQGVLGVMSYFEQEGSGTTADQAVWAALDWTFVNRSNLSPSQQAAFYGSANVPTSFVNSITLGPSRSQVFNSIGQLLPQFETQLDTILGSSPTSTLCGGLESAFNVAGGVLNANIGPAVAGYPYVPNPVPGALQFGSNGAVPSHSSSFTQGTVANLVDGNNLWTFYSDTPVPPPVRKPPGTKPVSPPRR
jgi:RHS repeat-associated protein